MKLGLVLFAVFALIFSIATADAEKRASSFEDIQQAETLIDSFETMEQALEEQRREMSGKKEKKEIFSFFLFLFFFRNSKKKFKKKMCKNFSKT